MHPVRKKRPPHTKSATGKRLYNWISRISSRKSAENFVSRNSTAKKFG